MKGDKAIIKEVFIDKFLQFRFVLWGDSLKQSFFWCFKEHGVSLYKANWFLTIIEKRKSSVNERWYTVYENPIKRLQFPAIQPAHKSG